MKDFLSSLYHEARKTYRNDYNRDNYDEFRFGSYPWATDGENSERKLSIKRKFKNFLKASVLPLPDAEKKVCSDFVDQYLPYLERTWQSLSKRDKSLYVKLISYRIFGFRKVKLPRNNAQYWQAIEKAKSMVDNRSFIDPHFLHFLLKKCNLTSIGYDIEFFFTEKGIAIDFILEQYAYKINDEVIIGAENGDVVLDLGACWGDTALYFADKVGNNGKVYSFEFIPGNLKILHRNLSINPVLTRRIELINRPITDQVGNDIFFFDNGPGSKVSAEQFPEQTGSCKTQSIDNFVKERGITKVDYIKMDIEGAEKLALKGAVETIKRFRPKLAVAIYHSLDDFATIPNWIMDLELDYEIFIDHFSIHAEETICFAIPKKSQ